MKKFTLSTITIACCIAAGAQPKSKLNDSLQIQITQVESNLAGPVRTTDQKPWTIQERMAFYKVPGVTVAVIKNYKIAWAKGYVGVY